MSKLGNFYGLSDIDIQKRFCFCIRNFRFGENKVNYSYYIRSLLKKHILSCYLKTDFMSKRHRGGEINGVLNIGGRRYFTSFKNVCNYQCEMSLFVVSLFGFVFFFLEIQGCIKYKEQMKLLKDLSSSDLRACTRRITLCILCPSKTI